jgi:hypothetical protein
MKMTKNWNGGSNLVQLYTLIGKQKVYTGPIQQRRAPVSSAHSTPELHKTWPAGKQYTWISCDSPWIG